MAKTYKTIQVEEREPESITCDRCGKTAHRASDWAGYQSFAQFSDSFGYGSKFDGENHYFDLCEDCYCHAMTTLGIKVRSCDYMIGTGHELKDTEHLVDFT
jgi:hypothetical protein